MRLLAIFSHWACWLKTTLYTVYKHSIFVVTEAFMTTVSELKASGQIWSLHDQVSPKEIFSTGFTELDQALQGGFPAHTVIELHGPTGIGELRLLLPGLTRPFAREQLLVLISPPTFIGSQMLQNAGFSLTQILVLHPSTAQDAFWAAEQCLKSGCCGSVLLWQSALSIAQLKRLQLCAQDGLASLFIFRGQRQSQLSLPVALSLQLSPALSGIQVQVLKRRGGWPVAPILVDMTKRWPRLSVSENAANTALILSHSA
jgi:protein ImuA